MELQILICVISLFCLQEVTGKRKFVLHNDMSEHCRRRVVSSIFLGRQVSDSSAKVLHFSRLDMPYSCSIGVRTESGTNIILVILSQSEQSIPRSCRNGHDQLLVYEMGETFGGYWGELPEDIFRKEPQNESTYYTLKTTQTLPKTADIVTTDVEALLDTEDIVTVKTTESKEPERDYVVMEVPLVNVSGNMELGEPEPTHEDVDDLFDLIYDVAPKNGVLYETSIMPLLQFSMLMPKGKAEGLQDIERRYQIDNNVQEYTPDYRLMFKTNNHKRKFPYRPHYTTRRFKFKKKYKKLFSVNNKINRIYSQAEHTTELITTLALRNKLPMYSAPTFKNHTDTWKLIESYLKLLNRNNVTNILENMDDEALTLLKRISHMKHNVSVYLQPNLLNYKDSHSSLVVDKKSIKEKKVVYDDSRIFSSTLPTRNNVNVNSQITNSTYSSSLIDDMSTAEVKIEMSSDPKWSTSKRYPKESTTAAGLPSDINHQERLGKLINLDKLTPVSSLFLKSGHEIESQTEKMRKSESGSLVDHESWENIVQVAPEMADLLNITKAPIQENTTYISQNNINHSLPAGSGNQMNRKKRYIQALSIEKHGPRQLVTKEFASTSEKNINHFDSLKLAELVELQDDEIQGRVALRYFKQYAGSLIFNMCDYGEGKTRQVFLLNSSRVVISINNFTMERIAIVMTESQVVRSAGCPPAHLECQVSGVRVCVHNMNACDGLPNCGAYDIYDEDRMLCGSTGSFHYSVFLAACTFLVVLLTFIYCMHYWLKRCIPKVSEAFFVYTDKSENILYLDTIMRSPTEFDGGSRLVYNSSFFDDDVLSTEAMETDNRKVLTILRNIYRFLFCKKPKRESRDKTEEDMPCSNFKQPNRKFSFTEAELCKICQLSTRNASNQTGDSLEIAFLKDIKRNSNFDVSFKSNKKQTPNFQQSLYQKEQIGSQNEKDLTTLRRLRNISSTLQSSSKDSDEKKYQDTNKYPTTLEEEVELHSTVYEREDKTLNIHASERRKYGIYSASSEQRKTAKHLRFEEIPTTIEASAVPLDDDDDDDAQRKITINTNADPMDEVKVAGTSSRDYRRFWGKGKKNKKKTQLSLL